MILSKSSLFTWNNLSGGRSQPDHWPKGDTTDSDGDEEEEDPRVRQQRQCRKLFQPTPESSTRLLGEHISVTLGPGMKQVIILS